MITIDLTRVVEQGRRRARLGPRGGRKTGRRTTTETPGSSGTHPSWCVAVWVGYPNELRPMETEFNGEPVAGGTLPALIWKDIHERAPATSEPTSFPYAAVPRRYVRRPRGLP